MDMHTFYFLMLAKPAVKVESSEYMFVSMIKKIQHNIFWLCSLILYWSSCCVSVGMSQQAQYTSLQLVMPMSHHLLHMIQGLCRPFLTVSWPIFVRFEKLLRHSHLWEAMGKTIFESVTFHSAMNFKNHIILIEFVLIFEL